MSCSIIRCPGAGLAALLLLGILAAPARSQGEATSMADLLAGTAVPHTIKLKELTPEWRRLTVGGEALLGTRGAWQSWMQSIGSMFGGTRASDALYTRGATVKVGDQEFLIGYRLPSQGLDFAAMMAAEGAGKGTTGVPPKLPQLPPITPETELSLVLVNLRAIASISDIRPFNMAEAMQPPPPSPLEGMFNQAKTDAQTASAYSNLKQLALAAQMYAQDYDETLPPMDSPARLKKLLMPYMKDVSIFNSPATGQPFLPNPHLSRRRLVQLENPAATVLFYAAAPEPDGSRPVAFLDGHVRAVPAAEWADLARKQGLPVR